MLLRGYQRGDVSPPRARMVVAVADGTSVRTDRRWAVAAAAVVCAAVALRVVALTAKALWFDETFSVFAAGLPVGRLLAILAANEPHPPLHFLLLHAWMGVFGDSEAAVRAPSVIVGAGVVAVTWLFGRRLIGPGPALLAAALVVVAPSQVVSGQEARMYGLLTLGGIASWWAMWAALMHNRRRAWIAYVLVSAAMLYSHYYGAFVVASQGIYLLVRHTIDQAAWRRWVYALVGMFVLFLPWLPALIWQLAGGRHSYLGAVRRLPITWGLFVDTLSAMTVGRPILEVLGPQDTTLQTVGSSAFAVAGLAAATFLALVGIRSRTYTRDTKLLLLCAGVLPLVLACGLSLGVNVFAPRYMLFIVPPLALLIGAGVSAVPAIGRRWSTWVMMAMALVVVVPNAAELVSYYRQPSLDVFDWRRVSGTMAAGARPDDAIVFLPGFARIPVNYYFRGPQPRLALTPDGTDVIGPGGTRMPGVVVLLEQHPRVWILTALPVPPSVDTLIEALGRASYTVTRQEAINMTRLLLLERTRAP